MQGTFYELRDQFNCLSTLTDITDMRLLGDIMLLQMQTGTTATCPGLYTGTLN